MSTPPEEPMCAEPPRDPVNGYLLCSYCGREAEYLDNSAEWYNGTDYGPLWVCRVCDASTSCHPGTGSPLDRLANEELRKAKVAAHDAFDLLWRAVARRDGIDQKRARSKGYRWLAAQLGVDKKVMHIGFCSLAGCRRVVEVCAPYREHAVYLTHGVYYGAEVRERKS